MCLRSLFLKLCLVARWYIFVFTVSVTTTMIPLMMSLMKIKWVKLLTKIVNTSTNFYWLFHSYVEHIECLDLTFTVVFRMQILGCSVLQVIMDMLWLIYCFLNDFILSLLLFLFLNRWVLWILKHEKYNFLISETLWKTWSIEDLLGGQVVKWQFLLSVSVV